MGYRGKVKEQEEARRLREQGMTVPDIATALGVSKSSVSLWVRDIEITIERRKIAGWRNGPNALTARRLAEIERLVAEGKERVGRLSDRECLLVGLALYAGEGAKTEGTVKFANSNPRMILFFVTWLRKFFAVDEARLRMRLYLHDGLDLEGANQFWSQLTGIPLAQFGKAYRAVPDPSIRKSKHPMGCPSVAYSCSRTHREIMGMIEALLSSSALPG